MGKQVSVRFPLHYYSREGRSNMELAEKSLLSAAKKNEICNILIKKKFLNILKELKSKFRSFLI